jgi:hypothetical protein
MVLAASLVRTKVMVVRTSTRGTILEVAAVFVRSWSGPGPDEGSCNAPFDLNNLGPDEPGLGPDEGDVQQLIKVRFYQF